MITIRKNRERGKGVSDWLNSFHTFSFADYHDPHFMGFGALRVINEDTVLPDGGFGRHPHNNMEIISYVIKGELSHRDSIGNGSTIRPGEIQVMSAGSGIEHSEFNHSKTNELHFLQIWITPNTKNLKPNYQQKEIQKIQNQLVLLGSNTGKENSVIIHQDVLLYVGYMTVDHSLNYSFEKNRVGWLQIIQGEVECNGNLLLPGDGAAITDENNISIICSKNAEFLLFDLHQ